MEERAWLLAFRRDGFGMGGAGEGFGEGMINAGMFTISHALDVGYGRLSAIVRGIYFVFACGSIRIFQQRGCELEK